MKNDQEKLKNNLQSQTEKPRSPLEWIKVLRDGFFRRKILAILLVLFTLIILFIAVGYIYINYQINHALSQNFIETEFVIKKGEGLKDIAKNLEEKSLIRSDTAFYFYIYKKGATKDLQAGEYILGPSMTTKEIADKIIQGEVAPRDFKITIPEGFTLKQIEERLKISNSQVLISNSQARNFKEDYAFLEDAPDNANLEGYLFPDTYLFDKDALAEEIIEKMLDNFDIKLSQDLREETGRQNKTIYEIITAASILEKEVRLFEDKKMVSDILWRRLEAGIPLQFCATITYITGKKTTQVTYEDLEIDSPYNTYKHLGLPPGPICNPGLESIKAAIYPQENEYWYYLSKSDDGETVFSKTIEEHNLAKSQYLQR